MPHSHALGVYIVLRMLVQFTYYWNPVCDLDAKCLKLRNLYTTAKGAMVEQYGYRNEVNPTVGTRARVRFEFAGGPCGLCSRLHLSWVVRQQPDGTDIHVL